MESKVIQELIIEADKADSLGAVKKSLKEIKGAMIAIGDEGSEDFKKLSRAAADLKDKVEDANAAIDRANPDKFNGLASAAKIAATGIQLTTGAMALFGDQSEDVQKALMKVQAAMMFAEGLQNIKELSKDWNVMTNAIKSNVLVQKLVTAAQWLWNAAILANPIIATIAGVIALGAAVYGLSKAFSSERSETERLTEALDKLTKSRESNNEQIDQTLKLQKALGLEGEKELKASIQANKEKIALLDKEQEVYSKLKKKTDEQIEADIERGKQRNKLLNEQSIIYATLTKFRVDQEAKADADIVKAQDEQIKADQANADKLRGQRSDNYKKEQEELKALKIQYHRENTDEDFLALEDYTARQKKYLEEDIITQDEYNEKLRLKKEELFGKFEAIERKGAETSMVVQEYVATERARIDKNEAMGRIEMAKELNDGLQNLSDLAFSVRLSKVKKGSSDEERILKQQFNVNKALQLSMTAINGIQNGITAYGAGLKAASAGGITAVAAPAWGAAYAAISAVGSLAALAKIASTQFGGGGGGGGVNYGGSTPSLGAINTEPQGTQPSTQLDANGNVLNQQPQVQQPSIRVHVVESDITATQNQVAVTETAMKFQ